MRDVGVNHRLNILLTGGSGFIGRNIVELMGDRYHFLAPSHKELDLLEENEVERFLKDKKIDVVVHSAVKPGHRNAKDLTNIFYADARMFFNLARCSSRYQKMIVLSSGAVYDIRCDLRKVTEDFYDTSVPADEHGFFRYVSAKYIETQKNIVELRIFSIFGKYEDYAIRFISNAICKAVYDLPITIKQNRCFDYLYINDFIPILDFFIQNNVRHKAYNVSPDHSIELYRLAEKIKSLSGKDLPIIVGQPGMGLSYSGDNSRMRKEIKDLNLTPIDDSLKALYDWYTENKPQINREFLLFDK
jgi:GDP-L-fucose synthase